jgi:hypothetical protein
MANLRFIRAITGTYSFDGTDTEELYNQNRQTLGPSWFWYNGPHIDYRINEQGFRMLKDFEDIDLDGYFLSLGCSFARGNGMPFEETYGHRLSIELGLDLVSLTNPGHGMDTFFHNFFMWVNKFQKLPKFVLLGHSNPHRKTYWVDELWTTYKPAEPGRCRDQSYKEFIQYESNELFDYRIKLTAIRAFCQSHNIKCIEFTGFDDHSLEKMNVPNLNTNLLDLPMARDYRFKDGTLYAHPGYEYQLNVVEYAKTQLC